MITMGSLFDGSGGFPLAGTLAGIKPVWASEIEPYPMRVTAARFPEMKQLGDVTKINGAEIEPVDVITFGSPCQDLSTAGKQAGIHDGKRSCLFFEAIRIIREMRSATYGRYPAFAVWENVPGAFSSNRGEDFREVLEAFVETIERKHIDVPRPEDGWRGAGCIRTDHGSVAWRVLDAQYWGVPQRRRRIYLTAALRDQRAAEILFEREGLRGDTAESREARERNPGGNEAGVSLYEPKSIKNENWVEKCVKSPLRAEESKSSHVLVEPQIAKCLIARGDGTPCVDRGINIIVQTKNLNAIKASMGAGGNQAPIKIDQQYIARRLTPLECCRLQGFPDWWEDGVEGSDTARYKMWGNGIALPCARYVMEGIADQFAGWGE